MSLYDAINKYKKNAKNNESEDKTPLWSNLNSNNAESDSLIRKVSGIGNINTVKTPQTSDILSETWNAVNKPFNSTAEIEKAAQSLTANKKANPQDYENKPRTATEVALIKGLDALTMGIPEAINTYQNRNNPETLARDRYSKQLFEQEASNSPIASTVGTIGGYALPAILGSGIVGAGAKTLLGGIVSNVGRVAVQEGLAGAGLGAVEGLTRGYSQGLEGTDLLGNVAKNTAIGGAFGAILGGGVAGIGKAYNSAKIFKEGMENVRQGIDNFEFPQLNVPEVRLTPEQISAKNSTLQRFSPDIPIQYRQPLPKLDEPLMLPQPSRYYVEPQFRTEIAGNPISNLKEPFATNTPTKINQNINTPTKTNQINMLSQDVQATRTATNMQGNINSRPEINQALKKPVNDNFAKSKYSPDVQAKIDSLNQKHKSFVEFAKRNIKDIEYRNKQIKGNAMEIAAKKRAIIQGDSLLLKEGGFTEKELFNRLKRLETNYDGKPVLTPDGEGAATGKSSFGKVGVKFPDGTVRHYPSENVKAKFSVDDLIKQEQEALNKATAPQKVESNINSRPIENKPIKTQNNANFGRDINVGTKTETAKELTPAKATLKQAETPKKAEPTKQTKPTKQVEAPKQTEPPKKTETTKQAEATNQKISKTRTNTIERAKDISDKSRTMLDEKEFGYDTQTGKEWKKEATERFVNDKQGIIDDLKSDKPIGENAGKEVTEASMVIKEAEQEALKTGVVDKLLSYTKKYAEKIRENARALKAHDLAWEKNPTPANAILKAQNTVTKAQDEIFKANPKLKAKVENDVKAYTEAVEKTLNNIADDTIKYIKINLQLFANKFAGKDKKLAEYIKKYYTSDPLERADSIKKIVDEFGLTGDEAKSIQKIIENAFDKKFNAQAQSYLKSLLKSDNKQNVTLEKVLKLIKSGAYDDTALANVIKEKYKLPVLTPDEAKIILRKMKHLERLDKESNAYRLIFGQVQKIIADKTPATLREKFRGIQRIAYLTNPKTLFTRNPLGNVVLNLGENIKDVPGAMIDMVTSAIRGSERTTLFNPAEKIAWQAEGFKKGFKDWLLDVKYRVDTSPTRGQLELPSGRTFDSNFLNANDEFVRKALQVGDRPFYEAAYNSRLEELMKIKKTNVPTDALKAEARLYALDRVFQNDSVLSKSAAELRRVLGLPGDLIIPFTQTPANVLDKLLDYSGAGLIKGLWQIGKTTVKGAEFNQKLFVDRLGRTFTGVGLLSLGYALASKGVVNGAPDKNEDKRNFDYSVGKTPYSIKFGDNYFTYDWAQPISGLLAMGSDAYFAGKSKEDFIGKITAGVEAGINTTFKQSFLKGFFNLLSGYSPAASITKTLSDSTLGLASPTLSKQFTKVIDPTQRETYSENNAKETANKIIKNIPLWSKSLPAKVDTFGNPVNEDKGFLKNVFEYMFNPGKLTEYKPNDVQKEILRVYDKTETKNIFPNVSDNKIKDSKGETHKLTTEQFLKHQTIMGKYVQDTMQQVINSNNYKNPKYTDAQRASALATAVRDSKKYADDTILAEMGLLDKKKVKRVKNPIKVPDNYKKKY